jgi:hypothetical protein
MKYRIPVEIFGIRPIAFYLLLSVALLSAQGCVPEPCCATPPTYPGEDTGYQPPDTGYQPPQGRLLNIPPIAQQTGVWCWAATAEMVFRYYGLPNVNPDYQCGIVSLYYGSNTPCWGDCYVCQSGIASMSEMQKLVNLYGVFANNLTPSPLLTPSPVLGSTLIFSALTFSDAAQEIDSGRPIIAGISANGYSYPNISQHAILIVGYVNDGSGQTIIVDDPFPYNSFPTQPNPYFAVGATSSQPGRFEVSYLKLVTQLQWGNTLYGIDRIQ